MSRDLVAVPVPPGVEGIDVLLPALTAALAGTGPAIAPLPVAGRHVPEAVHARIAAAARADGTPLESDAVAVVVTTSGSTGAPKGVLLSAGQLTALTGAVHGSARPQWVAALPVTSMGGLNVVVRALAAGSAPIAVAGLAGAAPFTAAAFSRAVLRACATSSDVRTALVPAQLALLSSDPAGIDALRACTQILVGGAALPEVLRERATEHGLAVVSTYGATETAGGCVFDGRPLPGVRVRSDTDGRLIVSGPNVAIGYRAEPRASADVFTPDGFRMPDLGQVRADGSVTVVGRVDDVVVVRGTNVSLLAVEAVLAAQPGVSVVAVVAVPGDAAGPGLHAFATGDALDPGHLADAVAAALGGIARPTVHLLGSLPLLPGGKVDRLALQQIATTAGAN